MKHQPLVIQIPEPCQQSWDGMAPAEGGRHCGSCQQTVIDFTAWSDTALYNFFAKNTGHVCGRYLATQVDRPIAIPYQPQSRLYRMVVAMGLTLMFTQAPSLYAQTKPPKTVATAAMPIIDTGKHTLPPNGEIRGVVVDSRREPIVNASIKVTRDGMVQGGGVTDFDGKYSVKPLVAGIYKIEVACIGYKTHDSVVTVTEHAIADIGFTLENGNMQIRDYIVVGYKKPLVDRYYKVPAEAVKYKTTKKKHTTKK